MLDFLNPDGDDSWGASFVLRGWCTLVPGARLGSAQISLLLLPSQSLLGQARPSYLDQAGNRIVLWLVVSLLQITSLAHLCSVLSQQTINQHGSQPRHRAPSWPRGKDTPAAHASPDPALLRLQLRSLCFIFSPPPRSYYVISSTSLAFNNEMSLAVTANRFLSRSLLLL